MRPPDVIAEVAVGDPIEATAPRAVAVVSTRRPRRITVGIVVAVLWLLVLLVCALLADVLPFEDPTRIGLGASNEGPSWTHPFGLDKLGRDQLSRLVHGTRVSIAVGVLSATIAGLVGSTLGLIAGFYSRISETLIMGAMDILLAAPALVLVIVLTSLMGPGVGNLVLAISILAVPAFARLARAQTLALRQRDFVKAARGLGATNRRIIGREIVPNLLSSVFSYILITIAVAIVVEGSLSFIGLGIAPDKPSWGGMIAGGRGDLDTAPHVSLIPAAAMFVTVLALNRLGEHVQARSGPGRRASS
jgi:ABC-type dipeptide/oligopeptide/nickel transport system permease subunit